MTAIQEQPFIESVPCARGCKLPGMHKTTCRKGRDCAGCAPATALSKSVLCGRCHRKFKAALEDIAELWPDMRLGVVRSSVPSAVGRVDGGTSSDVGDYWRPAVTGIMAEITDWVGFLKRLVDDDPRNRIPQWPTDTRVVLLAMSRYAARYLTHHESLGVSLVDDALSFQTRAHAALNSSWARRIPLFNRTCQHEVADFDIAGNAITRVCGGPISALLQPPDSGRGSAILCTLHPTEHKVPSSDWTAFADEIEAARG